MVSLSVAHNLLRNLWCQMFSLLRFWINIKSVAPSTSAPRCWNARIGIVGCGDGMEWDGLGRLDVGDD